MFSQSQSRNRLFVIPSISREVSLLIFYSEYYNLIFIQGQTFQRPLQKLGVLSKSSAQCLFFSILHSYFVYWYFPVKTPQILLVNNTDFNLLAIILHTLCLVGPMFVAPVFQYEHIRVAATFVLLWILSDLFHCTN
jgi:hypothetical protein